jgi:hypothetical protein
VTGPGQHDDAERARADEHARFEFDDAAYLLGALDAAEAEAFERHLRGCPICHDRIAEFGQLPELLHRADVSAWDPEPPPDTLLPRLLREVADSRRHRTRQARLLGVAAACLLALLTAGGVLGWQQAHRPTTLSMQAVGPDASGVHATVQLVRSGSETRVKLDCGYHSSGGSYPAASRPSYRMVIFNRRGEMVDLGSWTPQPDEDVQITRTSPWSRQNISRIEVADDQGRTVLRLRL